MMIFRFDKSMRFLLKFIVIRNLLWFEKIQATIDTSTTYHNHINWYTRYKSYPEYCSTPEQMSRRQIPPIRTEDFPPGTIGETRLVHVTALLRHGAVTPDGLNCWDDSLYDPIEKQWDCTLTTLLSAPPPARIPSGPRTNSYGNGNVVAQSSKSLDDEFGMFLFEKKYDSLKAPLANELNGTCEQGQLLSQGYEQEYTNGKIVRDAYLLTKDDHPDGRLKLLDSSSNGVEGNYLWDMVRYRSDDDQQTLMSGQSVLRGLFGPELRAYIKHHNDYPLIQVHTADIGADIIEPNPDLCPRLDEIIEETSNYDKDYARMFVSSKEAHLLSDFQRLVLKTPDLDEGISMVDCLMTTICTDRTLPDPVNDYSNDHDSKQNLDDNRKTGSHLDSTSKTLDKTYGSNRFQRLVNFETNWYGYYVTKNNGEFAKLAMGPLWSEILDTILPFVSDTENDTEDIKRPLFIIAGHDTTIVPLLVSLGPNVWDSASPPYASMMLIEIYSIKLDGLPNHTFFQSNYAFRLLYNGLALTDRIDGCHFEICDISILLNIVQSFATLYTTNCTRQLQATEGLDETSNRIEKVIGLVLLCILFALGGSMSTCIYMKHG